MNIQELNQAISLLEARKQLNDEWLLRNYSNPYRSNVHRDNRELEVQISTKRRTLDNISRGEPSHGYMLPEDTKPKMNSNVQNNKIQ